MRPIHLLTTILLLGSGLSAQTATYRIVGTGCTTGRLGGPVGPIPLSARTLPRLGTTFQLSTEGSARLPWGNSRRTFVMTGLSNTSVGGIPLPLDIRPLFAGWNRVCGLLRTSAEAVMRLPLAANYLQPITVSFPIPNDRSLLGLRFYQQVMSQEFSTFGPSRSVQLSAGGEGRIGF